MSDSLNNAHDARTQPTRDQVAANTVAIRRLESRVSALEVGGVVPPPIDPPVEPPDPVGRRFGMNLGQMQDPTKPYRPDQPLLPDGTLDPVYVTALIPVAESIRFMDKNQINDQLVPPSWSIWEKQINWQIDLCNACRSHFYLNVHYKMSSNAIEDTLAHLRSRLWHSATLYVEWANEPWIGGSTDVGREIMDESGAQLGQPAFFDVWASHLNRVFAAAKSADPNCVTVLATQTGSRDAWALGKLHDRVDAYDAIGVTTYFGQRAGKTLADNATLAELFDFVNSQITHDELPRLQEHLDFARDHGKGVVGYEGGHHLAVPGYLHSTRKNLIKTFEAAMDDPRLIECYRRMDQAWANANGGVMHDFNFLQQNSNWGPWGKAVSLDKISGSKRYQYLAGA